MLDGSLFTHEPNPPLDVEMIVRIICHEQMSAILFTIRLVLVNITKLGNLCTVMVPLPSVWVMPMPQA
jgi:hypothetical protein